MSSPVPKTPRRLALLLALSLLLNGCSEPPPPAPVQQSPWAAIAKGRVSIEGGVITSPRRAPASFAKCWWKKAPRSNPARYWPASTTARPIWR